MGRLPLFLMANYLHMVLLERLIKQSRFKKAYIYRACILVPSEACIVLRLGHFQLHHRWTLPVHQGSKKQAFQSINGTAKNTFLLFMPQFPFQCFVYFVSLLFVVFLLLP